MLGLEPGDEARRRRRPTSRKRTKACILWMSRRTALASRSQPVGRSGSARSSSACRFVLQPAAASRRARRSARGSRMADDALAPGRRRRAAPGSSAPLAAGRSVAEQVGVAAFDLPDDRARRARRPRRGRARRRASRRNRRRRASVTRWASIIGPSRSMLRQRTAPAAARFGATSARRSARSVSSVGRQSAATMNGRTLAIDKRQPRDVVEPQLAPAARCEDALDRLGAEPGHAQQHLPRRAVDVDREAVAKLERPGELGVDVERQHAVVVGRADDLRRREAVEAHQPVGLVEPVLAHQRRALERQHGAASGIGLKAE